MLLSFISKIVLTNINNLAKNYLAYEQNVEIIIAQLNELFNINLIEYLKTNAADFDFGKVLGEIFNSMSDLFGSAILIVVYALFIFLEESNFSKKLKAAFTESEKYNEITSILGDIEHSISNYIGMKSLVSLITGIVSYIALMLIGIDSPIPISMSAM